MDKPKLAVYWAASCGGCDIAILDIEAHLLDVAAVFDLVLWPVATDFKYADVERLDDGAIALTLWNGGIRTSENEHLARLLRRKSKLLVAFGSCAAAGGIPALANAVAPDAVFERVYRDNPSTVNAAGVVPRERCAVPEGELALPAFLPTLRPLRDVVAVDYTMPGCPPQPAQIWAVLSLVLEGRALPPQGAVLGAGEKSCCDECSRTREEKKLSAFVRPHQITPDPARCLLDQGVVCIGPATRSGCGALCPAAGMPCRGCYGPPPGVRDQGAKMLSALASVIDATDPAQIDAILAGIEDPLGTFYRFGVPGAAPAPPVAAAAGATR
jgi:F420-non-reducing hydrogenase small subunit